MILAGIWVAFFQSVSNDRADRHCGTSYSLFKRAMMTCVLYDSAMCGFADEWGCNPDDSGGYCEAVEPGTLGGFLSPVGLIQRGSKRWVERHAGTLGVQVSTTAL